MVWKQQYQNVFNRTFVTLDNPEHFKATERLGERET